MVGERVAGRYRVERELGRGGMATVYLAVDERLSRPVALKLLHPSLPHRARERFRREAEIAASLKHPNIVEVHDFGEDGPRGPYLVCELVDGENLRQWASHLLPVPPLVAALVCWEIARALAAAHARGVVHRDVKPENVLLARFGAVKLADFGLAATADQERLTSTGAVTGSLAYMAPERIDTGEFSPQSDVYALGVVLFELCANQTPFGGRGAAHLAASVLTKDAPRLDEVNAAVPRPLADLVAQCLARDKGRRPSHGGELAEALEAFVRAQIGAPADEVRKLLAAPEAYSAQARARDFESLVARGEQLLEAGQTAQAARLLDAALSLEPGSTRVRELLLRKRRHRQAWRVAAAIALACAAAGAGAWLIARPLGAPELTGAVATAPSTAPLTDSRAPSRSEETAPVSPLSKAAPMRSPDEPDDAGSSPPLPHTSVGPMQRPSSPPHAGRKSTAPPLARDTPPPLGQRSAAEESAPQALAGRAPEGSSASDALARAEASSPGSLRLSTRPWAEVFIDGQSRGFTPKIRELSLAPGRHTLKLVNPLAAPYEEMLDIAAGQSVVRNIELNVRKSEVAVRAPQGAMIFLDGIEMGVAPLPHRPVVEHGRHLLRARLADGRVLEHHFEVLAGQTIEVELEVP